MVLCQLCWVIHMFLIVLMYNDGTMGGCCGVWAPASNKPTPPQPSQHCYQQVSEMYFSIYTGIYPTSLWWYFVKSLHIFPQPSLSPCNQNFLAPPPLMYNIYVYEKIILTIIFKEIQSSNLKSKEMKRKYICYFVLCLYTSYFFLQMPACTCAKGSCVSTGNKKEPSMLVWGFSMLIDLILSFVFEEVLRWSWICWIIMC